MELLCDSHHGVYIPQIMARRLYDAGWSGIMLDDVIQLEIDPYEGEWYWESLPHARGGVSSVIQQRRYQHGS